MKHPSLSISSGSQGRCLARTSNPPKHTEVHPHCIFKLSACILIDTFVVFAISLHMTSCPWRTFGYLAYHNAILYADEEKSPEISAANMSPKGKDGGKTIGGIVHNDSEMDLDDNPYTAGDEVEG